MPLVLPEVLPEVLIPLVRRPPRPEPEVVPLLSRRRPEVVLPEVLP